ncbi:SusC/RagA family TonB-linked outer membrane protein [Flavobacterium sp. J49]|uniref:SusC/RagA family TonB-linked outer membrane protein n=1 Tax=Flavobacterium sp. J49 TaxID=2718534 RepID=UPI001593DD7F|nr:SusC/RagA family TonB-linked outer membrane protein [Flavobacterium sp. J49]MBF6640188.1 SusC/RagA family TonB-linked outer membrane protein [Flavobacterium sp. J49]NIC01433.1 SusC/RagA family TonB-linked outer membrane protein [Flavobacterium sp. J49]
MKNIYVLLSLLFFPIFAFSQTIEGKIVDEKGIALIGANITNTTMNSSTVSDMEGAFKINANVGDKIKVAMIGFETKTVEATQGMQVTLKEEVNQLQDVVIIGYGTRKKIDNTSVITSLKAEEITKTKVLNASQAIQGKAAGVQVIASDSPGSTPSVIIRGLGTAIGGRTPLFVVDGMPADNINNINANDIVSYEILKDATAKAIYGNRAANGVIIIETKKGKVGKLAVEVETFTGFRSPLSVVKMAGSNKFSYYTNLALGSTTFSQDQPVNTDWFKEITRTGQYSQSNLSLSGGSENIKYFFSAGYYDEEAILNGMDYSRLTFRNNNEYKVSNKIKLSQNFSVSYSKVNPKPFSAFTNAYKQSPIVPVYFPSGQYGVSFVGDDGFASPTGSSFNNVGNPVAQLDFFDEQQKSITLQGGLKLDIDILKGLKYSSVFNGEYYTWKGYNYEDTKNIWLAADPTREEADYPSTSNINLLTRSNDSYFNWNLSNYLIYNKLFADIHDVELTGGIEASSRGPRSFNRIVRKNVNANSNYWSLNGVDYASNVISYNDVLYNEVKLSSYFGRVQYKLMNKYLLTATVRRDGSSQFGEDYRWGTFPSVGLGWIITNEDFAKNLKGIDLLKLRGGWGKLGNQNVPLNSQAFTSGLDYYIPNYLTGITVDSQVDPSLSWEVTEETSVGLDFGFLNNRLTGTFDVYNKNTNNLILYTRPYITAGSSQQSPAHVGEVSNKGFELSMRWNDKINDDWSYYVSGNFSNNKNALESLNSSNLPDIQGGGLGNGQYTKLLGASSVGKPLGSFYLYDYAGYDPTNGQMLYYKADGTTTTQGGLEEADRKYFGSVLAKSMYGFSLGFTYKNFDVSMDSYGTLGSKVYNGKKAQRFSGENIENSLASNFWTPTNTDAGNPGAFNQVPVASTYYLESGDFWRINNITIGYKLPKTFDVISSARIYFNAINPFITKKFSGFSPELNGDGNPYGSQGVELDAYPTLKSFVFGINLKF